MTAPLHERLEAWAERLGDLSDRVLHDDWEREAQATLREAAAALRPPEGEVGALCERLGRGFEDAGEFTVVVDKEDLRAALAHLRRLAAVEAKRDRDREALAWLVDTLTEISFDGGDYDGANIQEDLTTLGILHQTEYDPERHSDNADCEPGDPYFEFTPYGKALIRVANEERRALAPATTQRPPRVLVMGNHALIQCSACGGSGEGELIWPEEVRPCPACDGAGHVMRWCAGNRVENRG